ncbi:hypothetical protein C8T65DRAFT_125229 [Cerioporus squamosus]|nr:hypothetical protein C8T65DRAFT_125229 [Cerioporus squamosus]
MSRQLRRLDVVRVLEATLAALNHLQLPLLKCLTAFNSYNYVRLWDMALQNVGHVAGLQGLALGEVIGLPTNQFPKLTHLYLSLSLWQTPSLTSLLTMLANTPALKYFHLKTCPSFSDNSERQRVDRSFGSVPLRSLRGLILESMLLDDVLTLTEHISMPRSPLIRITSWASAVSLIPGREHFMSRSVTTLQLATHSYPAHTLDIVAHTSSSDEDSGLWLSVTRRELPDQWPRMVHMMLPLSGLECLSVATRNTALLPDILPYLPCAVDL